MTHRRANDEGKIPFFCCESATVTTVVTKSMHADIVENTELPRRAIKVVAITAAAAAAATAIVVIATPTVSANSSL